MPPLNPLRVFEVAARLQSFSRAAEELRVTQSAVSRQIATLEGYLGAQLFAREQARVVLTKAGAAYCKQIAPALKAIETATEAMLRARREQPLRLRVYTTFASLWLIPRLPLFHKTHSRTRVKISNLVNPVNFTKEDLDLAIQFGKAPWSGMQSRLLLNDVIQPVCSPDFLKRAKLCAVEDLLHQPLLGAHYRRADWSDWLRGQGINIPPGGGTEFPSSMLAYQAAKEGLGIAMGQVALLQSDIASGALIPLFQPYTRQMGYYAVWPRSTQLSRDGRTFLRWLEAMVAAERP